MRKTMLLGLAALVSACGGGSGGSSAPPAAAAPPPPPASPAGIWSGTASLGGSVVNELACLVAANNQLGCLLVDPANGRLAGGLTGSVSVSGASSVGGSGTGYTTNGYVFANGAHVSPFTITSGTIAARNTLSFAATLAANNYSVSATFDARYDRPSSLATVAGVYDFFAVEGVAASFSITTAGALFSQAANGCVANGTVAVIDAAKNGYTVNVTLSSCGVLNGTYNGLGVMTDYQGRTNNVFLFGVFNAASGIVGGPIK